MQPVSSMCFSLVEHFVFATHKTPCPYLRGVRDGRIPKFGQFVCHGKPLVVEITHLVESHQLGGGW